MPESLPAVTLPRGLPAWLAAGHTMEAAALYADTPMRTGAARRRRIYTAAPRIVAVGLVLERAQAAAFWSWYEDRLGGGVAPFAACLPNQGPGLRWWPARFVEPPTYEALARGRSRITARLLLTGPGSDAGPADSAAIVAASLVALSGAALVTVSTPLSAASAVALTAASRIAAASSIALGGVVRITPALRIQAASVVALSGAAVPAVGASLAAASVVALQQRVTLAAASTVALLPGVPDGIFYASFNDGTPTDLAANPATYTLQGTPIYEAGRLVDRDTGAGTYGGVIYNSSKLDLRGKGFTLECDVAVVAMPQYGSPTLLWLRGPGSYGPRLVTHGTATAGSTVWWLMFSPEYSTIGLSTVATFPKGTGRVHVALVSDGTTNGARLYANGSLVWSGDVPMAYASALHVGAASTYTAMDSSIDNVRLRLGAQYSGSTITPPTYP